MRLKKANGLGVEDYSLHKLLEIADSGDQILLFRGDLDFWLGHPQGCVVRRDNKFLINGHELIYRGECNGWYPHPDGVVIRTNCPMLDGQVELPEARPYSWGSNPHGKVAREGDKLMLNSQESKEVIYEGPLESWASHHQGAMRFSGNKVYINYDLVYEGERIGMANSHPAGVVIRHQNRIILVVHKPAA